ncbi:MAG: hypothetical protein ACRD2T_17135, partial [Thermoanaerobaculia bacterium]
MGSWAVAPAQDPAYLSLRINEVIANNNSVEPRNCRCEFVDMIEIYNPTDSQIKLHEPVPAGQPKSIKLSDGTTTWSFREGDKINPRRWFLVFCDHEGCEDSEGGDGGAGDGICDGALPPCSTTPLPFRCADAFHEAHASFALDRDGETITLLGFEGEVIDQVTFPPLPGDVSYARFPDGEDNFVFNSRGTTTFGRCDRPPLLGFPACDGARNEGGSNVSPQIDLIDYSTNAPPSGEPVRIVARVKDERLPDEADIAQVSIVYRADGVIQSPIPMTFLRLETDESNLLDRWSLWEGQLDGTTDGSVIDFHLRVSDQHGGEGTSPETICPWPTGPCQPDAQDELPAGCIEECQVPYRYRVGSVEESPLVLNEVVPENQSVAKDARETLPSICLDGTQRCHFDDFV